MERLLATTQYTEERLTVACKTTDLLLAKTTKINSTCQMP
jgi:hypothetical protein